MPLARILRRVGCYGVGVTLLVGCAKPSVVDDDLAAGGAPAAEFSIDEQSVTFTARFSNSLSEGDRFMVEWLFPDGKLYLRKPVRRSAEYHHHVETRMPIYGKAPARYPGLWRVRLWRDGDILVDRLFEILRPARTPMSAVAGFQSLGSCGASQWNDPVIGGRRLASASPGVPGAWTGDDLLEAAGATYSSAVLLTGCAPG